jgi:uncharacterized protein with ATP-grasp and redox domains
MKIHPDCRPCLIKQMETTARAAGASEEKVRDVASSVLSEMDRLWNDGLSPPAVSAPLYHLTGHMCGEEDPFRPMKVKYTQEALRLLPEIERRVSDAADPFEAAVRISIAGNIIDFGTGIHAGGIALEETLDEFLVKPFFEDSVAQLRNRVSGADTILYIGDNAGETVFDRPLLGQLAGSRVFYAAKGGAIINDATVDDAKLAGVHHQSKVISTGSREPGTILEKCSEEFGELFNEADLIIAKGQGNFETLTELSPDGRVFMLFTVKCPVAADYLGASMRDMVVMQW